MGQTCEEDTVGAQIYNYLSLVFPVGSWPWDWRRGLNNYEHCFEIFCAIVEVYDTIQPYLDRKSMQHDVLLRSF